MAANVSLAAQDGMALSYAVVSTTATAATVVAAVTGAVIRVYKMLVVVGTAGTITIQDGSTALTGAMPLPANGSIALDLDGQPWFTTSKGGSFVINSGTATVVAGMVAYTQNLNN